MILREYDMFEGDNTSTMEMVDGGHNSGNTSAVYEDYYQMARFFVKVVLEHCGARTEK